MLILRLATILFIAVTLLSGTMANAAMPCCMEPSSMTTMPMDNDNTAGMPCHKSPQQEDTKSHFSCEKCRTCLGANLLLRPIMDYNIAFITVFHTQSNTGFTSYSPGILYAPPKLISS